MFITLRKTQSQTVPSCAIADSFDVISAFAFFNSTQLRFTSH